jgi:hypothetical protein
MRKTIAHEGTGPGIIVPERHIVVPTTDVRSHLFAEYGAYSAHKPVPLRPPNKLNELNCTSYLVDRHCASQIYVDTKGGSAKLVQIQSK